MTDKPKGRLDLSRQSRGGTSQERPRRTALDAQLESLSQAAQQGEVAERAEQLGLPLLHVPTAQIAPDPHQLRRLAHPDDLRRLTAEGDRQAAALLEELLALGQSIREHGQLQPAIVYRDSGDARFPQMAYRLVMGQRRWSGAVLTGVPSLWVAVVDRPSRAARIVQQHDENQQRQSLTDMERAWAIAELKAALEEEAGAPVPWRVVEERFQLSEDRRLDLLRLLRFDAAGQQLVARHRWAEWTLRPLHQAIGQSQIDAATATEILGELASVAEVTATFVSAVVAEWLAPSAPPAVVAADAPPASAAPADTDAPPPARTSRGRSSGGAVERAVASRAQRPTGIVGRLVAVCEDVSRITKLAGPGLEEADRLDALSTLDDLAARLDLLREALRAQKP